MSELDDADYDYCNDEFPVLSFAYALYCDPRFAKVSHETWLQSLKGKVSEGAPLTAAVLRKSGVYTAYLDDYTQDRKRVFPPGAIELITVTVATNPPANKADELYVPTAGQAKDLVDNYLFPELTGAPSEKAYAEKQKKKQGKRTDAKFAPKRPLLSCLALLLVNSPADAKFVANPAAFLDGKRLDDKENEALIEFVKSLGGDPTVKGKKLTPKQAEALAPGLIAEFTREPYVW